MTSAVFALLWILFVCLNALALHNQFSQTGLIVAIGGFIGLSKALVDSLSKDSLRVYFLLQRIRIHLRSQATTRWWFAARYDGRYTSEIIPQVLQFLQDKQRFRFTAKVDFQHDYELQVEIDETLVVRIQFDTQDDYADPHSHITVISKTIEVSYGYTKAKLEKQIVPVLEALKTFLAPEHCSYELNVDFQGSNPFFAVYVSHLRPDQIGDFNVVLRLRDYSASSRVEKVTISKSKMHVTALSTDVLRKLAADFILLSPDVKALSGVTSA